VRAWNCRRRGKERRHRKLGGMLDAPFKRGDPARACRRSVPRHGRRPFAERVARRPALARSPASRELRAVDARGSNGRGQGIPAHETEPVPGPAVPGELPSLG
jgi:hypothetical protein